MVSQMKRGLTEKWPLGGIEIWIAIQLRSIYFIFYLCVFEQKRGGEREKERVLIYVQESKKTKRGYHIPGNWSYSRL